MEIIPLVGLGAIRFGDTRKEVRTALQRPFETFRKDVGENDTDAFDDLGLHIYYDGQDRVEFVEGFGVASMTLHGTVLLGRAIDEVDSELRALGYSSSQTDVGLRYDNAGIVLTAPDGIVEGVGVFALGYYGNY